MARLRIRQFYLTNTAAGQIATLALTTDGYYSFTPDDIGTTLKFKPLEKDDDRKISGGLVLLLNSSASQDVKMRVMNGGKQLSSSNFKLEKGPSYKRLTFTADAGKSRDITVELQKYDFKKNKVVAGSPSEIKLISAYSYYY